MRRCGPAPSNYRSFLVVFMCLKASRKPLLEGLGMCFVKKKTFLVCVPKHLAGGVFSFLKHVTALFFPKLFTLLLDEFWGLSLLGTHVVSLAPFQVQHHVILPEPSWKHVDVLYLFREFRAGVWSLVPGIIDQVLKDAEDLVQHQFGRFVEPWLHR